MSLSVVPSLLYIYICTHIGDDTLIYEHKDVYMHYISYVYMYADVAYKPCGGCSLTEHVMFTPCACFSSTSCVLLNKSVTC